MTTLLSLLAPLVIPLEVCPKAPPGAQKYADDILGYVLWGVGLMFFAGLVLAIGAMPIGRWLGMHGATKMAVAGILTVIVAAILYVVAPGIVNGILGNGCI
ncbi:MAG: hypothetical protein IT193_13055 [Propionibacteriaceae bacterium]|nr:hypothetical protein [Propionibacteriaceae bacterium]